MNRPPARVRFPHGHLPDATCPACGADQPRAFYAVDAGLPSHRDLVLALCETCGLIFDAADGPIEIARVADSIPPGSFENCFREVAADWVTRFDLAGKTVVEIDCGDGSFLESLCQISAARGIGFAPGIRRERSDVADVLFVADAFEPFAADVRADFIFCRGTLDRLGDPLRFLTALREPLSSTPVAFTVDDATPTFSDGRYWDVHGDRRNYFTRESLTRLFQRAGFEVTRIGTMHGRIVLEAEPTGGQKRDMPTLGELRLASQFVRVATSRLQQARHDMPSGDALHAR